MIYLLAASAWLSHDLNSSTKHFPQPLNVHEFSDVRKREMYRAEPIVPESSAFGVQMAVGKLNSHKSPGIYQVQTELINLLKPNGYVMHHQFNLLKTNCNLLYIRNQSVPRCKHFLPRL
jgi:hypothetical protein